MQKKLKKMLRLVIGDRVQLSDYGQGEVKFIGSVFFAEGIWYGIELDEKTGRTTEENKLLETLQESSKKISVACVVLYSGGKGEKENESSKKNPESMKSKVGRLLTAKSTSNIENKKEKDTSPNINNGNTHSKKKKIPLAIQTSTHYCCANNNNNNNTTKSNANVNTNVNANANINGKKKGGKTNMSLKPNVSDNISHSRNGNPTNVVMTIREYNDEARAKRQFEKFEYQR
ncbi:DEAD/DEAH box helicase domain-containing protein [Reticulomyxa filosa]|uniref:DEAD/DEAH box helicase domain-containing protein n=1 Tax=Reticulomyxa filosa TaxID=46433 RepID=X6NFM2_RETFI|nr:DEAD/DEAH box helicase domain-containing protein [Reticulomyxa filosa]|eukprot:ETO25120.1 DEAD/DEAH box helicase domain-containing protein [Reticulomyxa filosa]